MSLITLFLTPIAFAVSIAALSTCCKGNHIVKYFSSDYFDEQS